jgi:regulator of RNase E activity RraA
VLLGRLLQVVLSHRDQHLARRSSISSLRTGQDFRREPGEKVSVQHALHFAQPGQVLVASGSEDVAFLGVIQQFSAQVGGLKGTMIDGAARDPVEIQAMNYPAFSRCPTSRKSRKDKYGGLTSSFIAARYR